MRQQFIVSVCAIVYNEEGKVLVTRRSKKESQGSGMLSYPGGKMEDIEFKDTDDVKMNILQETLRRELMEETGVTVEDDMKLINNHSFLRYDGDYSLMIVFLAKLKNQRDIELDEDEIVELLWLSEEELDEVKSNIYPTVYKIYKLAFDKIK